MGELILILGGARSGKSAEAVRMARERGGGKVLYVATAEPGDDEMRFRIEKHRAERPAGWHTLEAPYNVGQAIGQAMVDSRTDMQPLLWIASLYWCRT